MRPLFRPLTRLAGRLILKWYPEIGNGSVQSGSPAMLFILKPMSPLGQGTYPFRNKISGFKNEHSYATKQAAL